MTAQHEQTCYNLSKLGERIAVVGFDDRRFRVLAKFLDLAPFGISCPIIKLRSFDFHGYQSPNRARKVQILSKDELS